MSDRAIVDFSYPYLRLARKYDLPYRDVLIMADYYTHGRYQPLGYPEGQNARLLLFDLDMDIHEDLTRDLVGAAAEFHRIQLEGWYAK